MKPLLFHKMVASGNDFIVIDNRKKILADVKTFAKRVCAPHLGVGADGVLLIESAEKADFFMRIINPDGSEAEACGNGYRCVGFYVHHFLGFPKRTKFETLSGMIEVDVKAQKSRSAEVRVKMTDPTEYREKLTLESVNTSLAGARKSLHCAFINSGVPHVVVFVEALNQIDVEGLGRTIRNHAEFSPRGANVNFVEITGSDLLSIRTYERGVEDETLACGTGTVAAALVASLTDRVQAPVRVQTKSGEILKVDFEKSGKSIRNVFLEGGAEFVFEGKLAV